MIFCKSCQFLSAHCQDVRTSLQFRKILRLRLMEIFLLRNARPPRDGCGEAGAQIICNVSSIGFQHYNSQELETGSDEVSQKTIYNCRFIFVIQ